MYLYDSVLAEAYEPLNCGVRISECGIEDIITSFSIAKSEVHSEIYIPNSEF
jgi:hypothetical protein